MIHPPQVRPEEPIAVTPHDGICGGESQQWLSYPTNPHVRFDERGRETERCRMAQATAPVLDSTLDVVMGDLEARICSILEGGGGRERGSSLHHPATCDQPTRAWHAKALGVRHHAAVAGCAPSP